MNKYQKLAEEFAEKEVITGGQFFEGIKAFASFLDSQQNPKEQEACKICGGHKLTAFKVLKVCDCLQNPSEKIGLLEIQRENVQPGVINPIIDKINEIINKLNRLI